jgi:hypothetical protein
MPRVDVDFQRYIERRRGRREAEAREGAAYAYQGDARLRTAAEALRPVRVVLETAARLYRDEAQAALLNGAERLGPASHPALFALVEQASSRLRVAAPPVYLTPQPLPATSGGLLVLGVDEDRLVLVARDLGSALDEGGLIDLFGSALGRLQNGHALLGTAHYLLGAHAGRFVRWTVAPATFALRRWAGRAEVTADRAGLLASRDLGASCRALVRRFGTTQDDPAALIAAALEPFAGHPLSSPLPPALSTPLGRRLHALRLFSQSTYLLGIVGAETTDGVQLEGVDARVAQELFS